MRCIAARRRGGEKEDDRKAWLIERKSLSSSPVENEEQPSIRFFQETQWMHRRASG